MFLSLEAGYELIGWFYHFQWHRALNATRNHTQKFTHNFFKMAGSEKNSCSFHTTTWIGLPLRVFHQSRNCNFNNIMAHVWNSSHLSTIYVLVWTDLLQRNLVRSSQSIPLVASRLPAWGLHLSFISEFNPH